MDISFPRRPLICLGQHSSLLVWSFCVQNTLVYCIFPHDLRIVATHFSSTSNLVFGMNSDNLLKITQICIVKRLWSFFENLSFRYHLDVAWQATEFVGLVHCWIDYFNLGVIFVRFKDILTFGFGNRKVLAPLSLMLSKKTVFVTYVSNRGF